MPSCSSTRSSPIPTMMRSSGRSLMLTTTLCSRPPATRTQDGTLFSAQHGADLAIVGEDVLYISTAQYVRWERFRDVVAALLEHIVKDEESRMPPSFSLTRFGPRHRRNYWIGRSTRTCRSSPAMLFLTMSRDPMGACTPPRRQQAHQRRVGAHIRAGDRSQPSAARILRRTRGRCVCIGMERLVPF